MARAAPTARGRPADPVRALWRGWLSVALDALGTEGRDRTTRGPSRRSPWKPPTSSRRSVIGRKSRLARDAAAQGRPDHARGREPQLHRIRWSWSHTMEAETAHSYWPGWTGMDCNGSPRGNGIATQLVRRLADRHPTDLDDEVGPSGCEGRLAGGQVALLSVAVAMWRRRGDVAATDATNRRRIDPPSALAMSSGAWSC